MYIYIYHIIYIYMSLRSLSPSARPQISFCGLRKTCRIMKRLPDPKYLRWIGLCPVIFTGQLNPPCGYFHRVLNQTSGRHPAHVYCKVVNGDGWRASKWALEPHDYTCASWQLLHECKPSSLRSLSPSARPQISFCGLRKTCRIMKRLPDPKYLRWIGLCPVIFTGQLNPPCGYFHRVLNQTSGRHPTLARGLISPWPIVFIYKLG